MVKRTTEIQHEALLREVRKYGNRPFKIYAVQEDMEPRRRMNIRAMVRALQKHGYEAVEPLVWRKKN